MSALAYRTKKSNGHSEAAMVHFAKGLRITPARLERFPFWVAEKNTEIIGCIALDALGNGTGEVRSFFIAPEHQGRRIGSRLLFELVTIAHTQGIVRLQAHADPVSVKHYERLGFRTEGTVASRTNEAVEVPFMLRDI